MMSQNNGLCSLDNGLLKCHLLRLTHKLFCLNWLRWKDGLRHDNFWGRLLSLGLLVQLERALGSCIERV